MIGVESCDRCGFRRADWNEQDASRTLLHASDLLDGWSADSRPALQSKLLARRGEDVTAVEAAADLHDRVHHLWHGLMSIADLRRAGGDAVSPQHGRVDQLNASGGGVPKSAIGSATIGRRGMDGDTQQARMHHGRPWQALCLWSREVIDGFASEGHPIDAGSAGENVTISGLDWTALRGGTIVDLGDVRIQLSAPAVPCQKNARWFRDGDVSRIDHDLHPGSSRWYASVLTPGSVASGDAVVVSPT